MQKKNKKKIITQLEEIALIEKQLKQKKNNFSEKNQFEGIDKKTLKKALNNLSQKEKSLLNIEGVDINTLSYQKSIFLLKKLKLILEKKEFQSIRKNGLKSDFGALMTIEQLKMMLVDLSDKEKKLMNLNGVDINSLNREEINNIFNKLNHGSNSISKSGNGNGNGNSNLISQFKGMSIEQLKMMLFNLSDKEKNLMNLNGVDINSLNRQQIYVILNKLSGGSGSISMGGSGSNNNGGSGSNSMGGSGSNNNGGSGSNNNGGLGSNNNGGSGSNNNGGLASSFNGISTHKLRMAFNNLSQKEKNLLNLNGVDINSLNRQQLIIYLQKLNGNNNSNGGRMESNSNFENMSIQNLRAILNNLPAKEKKLLNIDNIDINSLSHSQIMMYLQILKGGSTNLNKKNFYSKLSMKSLMIILNNLSEEERILLNLNNINLNSLSRYQIIMYLSNLRGKGGNYNNISLKTLKMILNNLNLEQKNKLHLGKVKINSLNRKRIIIYLENLRNEKFEKILSKEEIKKMNLEKIEKMKKNNIFKKQENLKGNVKEHYKFNIKNLKNIKSLYSNQNSKTKTIFDVIKISKKTKNSNLERKLTFRFQNNPLIMNSKIFKGGIIETFVLVPKLKDGKIKILKLPPTKREAIIRLSMIDFDHFYKSKIVQDNPIFIRSLKNHHFENFLNKFEY